MKVALVSFRADSAVDQVLQDLIEPLAERGVRATLVRLADDENVVSDLDSLDVDLIHVGYAGYLWGFDPPSIPMTTNMWHIVPGSMGKYQREMTRLGFRRYVVDDVMTLQILGQMGFCNVTPIPMAFNPGRWESLLAPPGDFTVGCFGDSFPSKRFDVIIAACKAADVRCYAMVTAVDRKFFAIDPRADVYEQIHVLAHASFTDTNCRPALEALACGRPVVSTVNDGLRRLIAPPGAINWYDGSVGDLARTIGIVRANYSAFRDAVLKVGFPDLEVIASKYRYMWESVLESEQ